MKERNHSILAKKIKSFLEDNLRDKITVQDIADNMNMSVRNVHIVFTQEFKTTVMVYLLEIRLNSARRALIDSEKHHDSVTRIAMDNGFNHLGRFSQDYFLRYGEYPLETLLNPTLERRVKPK